MSSGQRSSVSNLRRRVGRASTSSLSRVASKRTLNGSSSQGLSASRGTASTSTLNSTASSSRDQENEPPTPSSPSAIDEQGSNNNSNNPSSVPVGNPNKPGVTATAEQVAGIRVDMSTVEFPDGSEGISPLYITSNTRELFHLKLDRDVSEDKPLRLLAKSALIADISSRGPMSDFHPAKEAIKAAPTDQILIAYDSAQIFGDNFFLILAESARRAVLGDDDAAPSDLNPDALDAARRGSASGSGGPGEDGVITKPNSNNLVARPWESLGSELEVEDITPKATRPLVKLAIARERRGFGAPYKFSDRDAHDGLVEFRPFKDPNFDLKRAEDDAAVQAVPEVKASSSQTTWNRPVNAAVQYEPLAMDKENQEEIQASESLTKFLSNVLPGYEVALQQNETMDLFADDFAALAEDDGAVGNKSDGTMREFQSFMDIHLSKGQHISAIDWQPGRRGVLAVACTAPLSFEERVDASTKVSNSVVLVWNFADPIHPQFVLEAPSDVTAFKFNPQSPQLVAAGCANGQVVMWDISSIQALAKTKVRSAAQDDGEDTEGREASIPHMGPTYVSMIESGHKLGVGDLVWLPPGKEIGVKGEIVPREDALKSVSTQFVTVARDGQFLVWSTEWAMEFEGNGTVDPVLVAATIAQEAAGADGTISEEHEAALADVGPEVKERLLLAAGAASKLETTWGPAYKAQLGRTEVTGDHAATRLHLSKDLVAGTKFLMTTEEGALIHAHWVKQMDERRKWHYVSRTIGAHTGPVTALAQSPFYSDVFLTAGDWSWKVWKEDLDEPILASAFSPSMLTCAQWSPSRPGVLFTGAMDGTVELWDFLDRSHEPLITQPISSVPITSLEVYSTGGVGHGHTQLMAVGDASGSLHIMELPRSLVKPAPSEKSLVLSLFEREVKRVAYSRERRVVRSQERVVVEREQEQAAIREELDRVKAEVGEATEGRQGSASARGYDPRAPPAEADSNEAAYRKMEEEFKMRLGLAPPV